MLTLSDIIDITITNSGEFILGDEINSVLASMSINKNRFWRIVKQSLEYYQKYAPISKNFNIVVNSKKHTFVTDAPLWIAQVTPVGLSSGFLMADILYPGSLRMSPRTFLWKYESPDLFVTERGTMDITGMYNYPVTITTGSNNMITEVQIDKISEQDDEFLNLVLSYFLIALGRSRRAFTLSDIPIEMDGDTLVSEGTDLLEKSKEELHDRSKWWEGVGM